MTTIGQRLQQAEVALNDAQDRIAEALRGLRFGAIEIQVHDSRIVRITRTEKVRIEPVTGTIPDPIIVAQQRTPTSDA